jgi:hypothetical protein
MKHAETLAASRECWPAFVHAHIFKLDPSFSTNTS